MSAASTAGPLPGSLPSSGREVPRILVIGDSLALGASVVERREITGFVSPHLVDRLRAGLSGWRIDVDAAPLRRTRDAAECISAALARSRPSIVVLATGSNDVDIDWRRFVITGGRVVRSRTPDREYAESVRSIGRAVALTRATLVMTDAIPTWLHLRTPALERALGSELRSLIETAGGQARADEIARTHRARTAHLAREVNAWLVAWGAAMARSDPERVIGPDGTHPNAEGHRVMAAELLGVLIRIIHSRAPVGAAVR